MPPSSPTSSSRPRARRTRAGGTAAGARVTARAADRFALLVEIMQALRGPGGCPWDRQQTFATLRPYVLEETYEVLEAIDRDDVDALKGELGDFLFEAVFLAQIAADEGHFTMDEALDAINAKLVRRHPHVFGTRAARAAMHAPPRPGTLRAGPSALDTAGKVLEQWEAIKAKERSHAGKPPSLLAGVPRALPALLRAHEIGTRAASVGFDWPDAGGVVEKIEEEVAELREAVDRGDTRHAAEEMGDLLFSIANLARRLDIEPESALREANEKFTARFEALEASFARRGKAVGDASLDEMERVWQSVKERGRRAPRSARPSRVRPAPTRRRSKR